MATSNEHEETERTEASVPETVPSDVTIGADEADAEAEHRADRMPTDEEERMADEAAAEASPEVAEQYAHMTELGAKAKGEGRPGP